jgi:FkbM family methyltransferase
MMYPDSDVYCFEPYKPHFETLNKNILNSGFKDIHPFQYGLAGDKRHSLFYLHAKNSGAHSIYPEDLSFQTIEIDLIDLNTALGFTSSGMCDLLKLDCEGAEYEIIRSIDKTIAPRISHIVYEATVDRYDPKELNEHLESVGYRVEQVNGYIYKATFSA